MKKSADLFRLIVESMADIVTVQDSEGCLVYVNPSVQRLTGFSPEELVGTPEREFVHPDDLAGVEQATSAAIADGRAWEMEYRCRTRDGRYLWLAARSQVLRAEDGQTFHILRRMSDLTEGKKIEERAGHARQLEAVGRLAGGVAHEFNNLLTVIAGYASLLLDTHGPNDPDHEALSLIQHAAEKTAALVRKLLAVGGRQMLDFAVVDLNALVLHLSEVFKRLLGPRIHLHLNLDPSLWPIKVDPDQIEQILLDLATNARDAMPSGGQLSLTTSNVNLEVGGHLTLDLPPGPAVRLTVCDTGRGMDEETLAHLFEPFFTFGPGVGGAGLGLAAVHGIVRQCGGHIEADSRPGAGVTFTITFPFVAVPPSSNAASE